MSKIPKLWSFSDKVPTVDEWDPAFKVGNEIVYQGIQYKIIGVDIPSKEYTVDGGSRVYGPALDFGMIIRHPRYDDPSRSKLAFRDAAYLVGADLKDYEKIREERSSKQKKIMDSKRSRTRGGSRKRKTRRNTKRRKSNRRR